MIIEEPSQAVRKTEVKDLEHNIYREAQESNDMAKRGYQDKIKFSNKRSRPDAEDFDVDMTDAHGDIEKSMQRKKKQVIFNGRKRGVQRRRVIQ